MYIPGGLMLVAGILEIVYYSIKLTQIVVQRIRARLQNRRRRILRRRVERRAWFRGRGRRLNARF